MADEFVFRGNVDEAAAAAARFRNQLEDATAKLDETTTETTAAQIEYAKKLMYGPVGAAGAQQIEEATAALERQAQVLAQNRAIQAENVGLVRDEASARLEAAAAARLEAAAVTQRLQSPAAVTPSTAIDAGLLASLTASNKAREEGVALDVEDLAVLRDQAKAALERTAVQAQMLREANAPVSGLIVPATSPVKHSYGRGEADAGQQVAAQEALDAQRAEAALAAQRAAALTQGIPNVTHSADTSRVAQDEESRLSSIQAARSANAYAQIDAQKAAYAARLAAEQATADAEARETAELAAQLELETKLKIAAGNRAFDVGGAAAQRTQPISAATRASVLAVPKGVDAANWTAADAELQRYNMALGQLTVYEADASLATEKLAANTMRLGLVQANSSDVLRKHGALTTEYLGALARGETTINEFGYQLGATIGKFGGWAAAAALTYGALGAVVEFGKGALDAASSVQQLTRTIPELDKTKASTALQGLAASVNVPMKEAGDAVFLFSRTFHTLDDAVTAAGLALATYKLDGVAVADSVKAATAIHQQFGLSASQLKPIYDELANGQQKFNARVSDQIPLLLRSASAVKAAGGDLRSFIELSTIALRTSNLPGGQLGTAFSRSAANFLSPTTTKGQADRAVLQQLGINPNQDYTTVIFDALKRAGSLTPQQQSELSQAIFGPLRGGLLTGFISTGQSLVPSVGRDLSPAGSKGVLQEELQKELGTASQQLHAFINGLQELGAAFANTGALAAFSGTLGVLSGVVNEIRKVVDAFDSLSPALKEAISLAVELRLAMLFVSRTRIGGSIPGIRSVPGFRPSEGTQARQTLALANRPVIDTLRDDAARTSATLIQTASQTSSLQAKLAEIDRQLLAGEGEELTLVEARAATKAEIAALTAKQVALETEANYQYAALDEAQKRQVTYTASNRTKQLSDANAIPLANSITEDAAVATDVSASRVGVGAYVTQQTSRATARLKAALGLQTEAATGLGVAEVAATEQTAALGVAQEEVNGQLLLMATENEVLAGALAADEVAMITARSALAATGAAMAGVAESVGGMILAIDPLMAAIIALPIALTVLGSLGHQTDEALKKAIAAANQPLTSFGGIHAQTLALQRAVNLQAAADKKQALEGSIDKAGPFAIVATPQIAATPPKALGSLDQRIAHSITNFLGITSDPSFTGPPAPTTSSIGKSPFSAFSGEPGPSVPLRRTGRNFFPTPPPNYFRKQDQQQREVTDLATDKIFLPGVSQAITDSENVASTEKGRNAFYAQLRTLTTQFQAAAANNPGADTPKRLQLSLDRLQQVYNAYQSAAALLTVGKDPFKQFEQLSPKQVSQQVQSSSDYSQIFGDAGAGGAAQAKEAAYAYTYLAGKLGGTHDDTDMQTLSAAQTAYISKANKNVQDLLHAAAAAPTFTGEVKDVNAARAAIEQRKQNEINATNDWIKQANGNQDVIARAKAAENQVLALLSDSLKSVTSANDTLISTQGALRTSQITGTSPAADIARAVSDLTTLKAQLANAQGPGGDANTAAGLQTQYNTAQQALAKQRSDYARSIIDAQGQLATSSIIGTSPAADMARARQDLANAQALLTFDQKSNAGLPAILADQSAVEQAKQGLLTTIQSTDQQLNQDLAAFIMAKASVAESQTTNPVTQAREELAAAQRAMKTIKPQDYKSHTEYETALLNQQKTINDDRTKVTDQLVQTNEATLKFELDTQQISSAQYVDGLQRLLKLKHLSLAQQQQLREEIFNANQSGAVDLNVGSIKLPTTYEVRKAIAEGQRHREQGGGAAFTTQVANTNTFNITVHKDVDLRKVTDAIAGSLGTNTQGVAQALGMI